MAYTLKLHRDVEKQLNRIPTKQRERLFETMRSLRDELRPHGCQHLQQGLPYKAVGQFETSKDRERDTP